MTLPGDPSRGPFQGDPTGGQDPCRGLWSETGKKKVFLENYSVLYWLRYLRSDTGWLKQPTSTAHTGVKLLD